MKTICSGYYKKVPLDENSIDIVLMSNVLHGFVEEAKLTR